MNNLREQQQTYLQQFDTIDTPERIFSLLKPAVGSDALLKIVPDSSDEIFHTTLLDIDYGRKLLTVKKIKYTFGHLMVIDAKRLTVYSQRDGAQICFDSHLSRYSERNEGFYEIRFPPTIKYCQRRMSHRVPIRLSMDIKVTITGKQGEEPVEGFLRDISSEGLRLQLPGVNPGQFKETDVINNCVISLPDRSQMSCSFQVKHKQSHVRDKGCTIGGAFCNMSREQKREVQKFIASLERRARREIRL